MPAGTVTSLGEHVLKAPVGNGSVMKPKGGVAEVGPIAARSWSMNAGVPLGQSRMAMLGGTGGTAGFGYFG